MRDRVRGMVFLAVLAAAVALYVPRPVEDTDTFWHLASGRLIVEQGVPRVNTFSSTHPDYPWPPTEWLFDGLLFLAYRAGGFNGVIALTAAFVLLTLVALADLFRRLSGRLTWWHLLACGLWLQFSRFRFVGRPHLVTFLCLALLLNLWFRRKTPGVLAAVPVLAVAWANAHAGVVFGVILALLLLAGRAAAALQPGAPPEARDELREGVLFLLLFAPATLLNRSFAYPYAYTFGHLAVSDILPIEEFQRTTFRFRETFFAFAALLLATLPAVPRRRRWEAVAASLPFLALAIFRVRTVPKFGIVALPFLCLGLEAALERLARPRARWAAGLALAGVLAVFTARDLRLAPPGLGLGTRDIPAGAARFLLEQPAADNLFNDFDDGGYLIFALYPRRRVFQDGRIPHYPASFFAEVVSAMDSAAWGRLMDKYGVNTAVVKRRPGGIDYSGFFTALGWPLVYLDGHSYVFARDVPRNREVIERCAFRVLAPHMSEDQLRAALRGSPDALGRDLLRLDPALLTDPLELVNYGYTLYRLGQPGPARRFLAEGPRRFPEVEEFDVVEAQLLRDEGRNAEAIRRLDAVLARTEKANIRDFAAKMREALAPGGSGPGSSP